MTMKPRHIAAVAALGLVLGACTPASRDEYSKAGNEAAQAIKTDTQTAVKATKAATEAAQKTISEKSPNSGNALGNSVNALQTPKVKTELMAAKNLDTSHLNVETVGKKIYLKGSVPSAAQKHQAEAVAKKAAGNGYQVVDQLGVAKK